MKKGNLQEVSHVRKAISKTDEHNGAKQKRKYCTTNKNEMPAAVLASVGKEQRAEKIGLPFLLR